MPDAPWMPSLRERLAGLGVGAGRAPQISQDDMAAVNAMSQEDRAAFIDSMIARLAERLESAPDDADGWLMLARSQLSLGRRDAAIAALERGISVVGEQKRSRLQAFLDNVIANPDL